MRKFLLSTAFAAAALASTAVSAHEAQRHFTRDGETYAYTIDQKPDRIVLIGTNETTGSPFQLTVQGDMISGNSGGMPVSFRSTGAQAKVSAAATQLASR